MAEQMKLVDPGELKDGDEVLVVLARHIHGKVIHETWPQDAIEIKGEGVYSVAWLRENAEVYRKQ